MSSKSRIDRICLINAAMHIILPSWPAHALTEQMEQVMTHRTTTSRTTTSRTKISRTTTWIAALAAILASPLPLAKAQEAITLETIGAVRMAPPAEARRRVEDATREQAPEIARGLRPAAMQQHAAAAD